jgi:hypothetical protein
MKDIIIAGPQQMEIARDAMTLESEAAHVNAPLPDKLAGYITLVELALQTQPIETVRISPEDVPWFNDRLTLPEILQRYGVKAMQSGTVDREAAIAYAELLTQVLNARYQ